MGRRFSRDFRWGRVTGEPATAHVSQVFASSRPSPTALEAAYSI